MGRNSTQEDRPPEGLLPQFVTVGPESGLSFERFDDISPFRRILEVNGGGVALFDYDGDGQLDVFLTNGCQLPVSKTNSTRQCEFFRNLGGLRFQRVTTESRVLQPGYNFGCAVGDYDSDGFDDLYLTAFGRNALWQNNGDGTFTDVADGAGARAIGWSSSAAFADVNGDGHLDLYIVNYLEESDTSPRLCRNSSSPGGFESCSPSLFEGVDDVLLISDGAGQFIDATKLAGLEGLRGKGLGVVVSDFDDDGDMEIFVANDGQANHLLVPVEENSGPESIDPASNSPKIPRFKDRAIFSGVALNESGYAQASMGVALGDYNSDGRSDLFLSHFYGDTNTLYANLGDLRFEDRTRTSQLGSSSRLFLGWGTEFFDADNDGWLDLFVANGHIEDRTWMDLNVPYRMRPLLYRNEGNGQFSDVSKWGGEYFGKKWLGRGAAIGDLDRDNRMDLVISHQLASSIALHNVTATKYEAITIQLVGRKSNRSGVGTRVEVLNAKQPILRESAGGGSFQSASAREIHLGMGDALEIGIKVHWPSGRVDTHSELRAGRWLAIEGQGLQSLPVH